MAMIHVSRVTYDFTRQYFLIYTLYITHNKLYTYTLYTYNLLFLCLTDRQIDNFCSVSHLKVSH